MAVSRSGSVLQKVACRSPRIGAPAVEGGVAFIPWGSQYVSALDLDSGKEVGRLLLREQVSHAVNVDGKLYFGELSLVRFDDKIGSAASGGATRVTLPVRELPGKPAWFDDGAKVEPAVATARERIRLYAAPAGGSVSGRRIRRHLLQGGDGHRSERRQAALGEDHADGRLGRCGDGRRLRAVHRVGQGRAGGRQRRRRGKRGPRLAAQGLRRARRLFHRLRRQGRQRRWRSRSPPP